MVANGWLNHVYGGRWTEPAIEDALRQVAEAGFQRVVYYPYGFVADNAESELEGRVALRGRPELVALHLPCLNDSRVYLAALARQVLDATTQRRKGQLTVTPFPSLRPCVLPSHSTVTDFARFLGWSTLQPRRTAT